MSVSTLFQVSLITVTSCVVYSGVARGPFLYDDEAALLNNADVQGNTSLWNIWSNDFWGVPMGHITSHMSYRPLTVLYFRCLHSIWENWATPFHISNIILHAIVSSLFFFVCRKHVFDQDHSQAPVIAGLLFSLHPIHTEAVCGIVGCAELLSAICFMTSLLIYPANINHFGFKDKVLEENVCRETRGNAHSNDSNAKSNEEVTLRYRKSKSKPPETIQSEDADIQQVPDCVENNQVQPSFIIKSNRFLSEHFQVLFSVLLATIAMLCKESGVTVLGVIIGLEAIRSVMNRDSRRSFLHGLDGIFIFRSAFVCTAICSLIAFRMWMMNWKLPNFQDYDNPVKKLEDRSSRIMSYFSLCWINFGLLLYPIHLCYDYSFPTVPLITSIWHPRNIVSASFLALCIFCIIIIMKCFADKQRMSKSFVMGCFMLVFPFLPASNLFFPVGFVVAERCLYLPSAGFIILIVWSCSRVIKLFPSAQRLLQVATALLMVAYFVITARRSLDWTSKERLFRSGVEVNPKSAKILYNWGNYLLALDLKKEAETQFRKAVELNPNFMRPLNNLATCMELRDPETWPKVEEMYDRITRTTPGYFLAHVNLAGVQIKLQKFKNAAKTALHALKSFSGDRLSKFSVIARSLLDANKTAEAEVVYYHLLNKVCQIEKDKPQTQKCFPGYTNTIKEYTYLLGKKGQKIKSEKVDNGASVPQLIDSNSLLSLSNAMLSVGDADGAAIAMLKAVKLDRSKTTDLWKMARNLFQRGHFIESKLLYQYYVTTFPNDSEAAAFYAGALIESGEAESGERMLVTMTSNDPSCQNIRALTHLTTIYGRKGKHTEAIELLNLCLDRRKRSAQSCSEDHTKSTLLTQLAKHGKYKSVQLKQNGDIKSAKKLWKTSLKYVDEALQLHPSNTAAQQIKYEIENERIQ